MEHEGGDVATASVPIETLGLTAEGTLSSLEFHAFSRGAGAFDSAI